MVESAPTSFTTDQLTRATTRCTDIRVLFLREYQPLVLSQETGVLLQQSEHIEIRRDINSKI